jgi:hypothetical protein
VQRIARGQDEAALNVKKIAGDVVMDRTVGGGAAPVGEQT